MDKIFAKPLRVPEDGEKVYQLSKSEIERILRMRGLRTELQPGMGGENPWVLDDLLKESELVSVDLALTSACNFKCGHCYRPDEEWGKLLLEWETVSRAVNEAHELGVKYFILTGGEPFMYRSGGHDYFDVVDMIREMCGDDVYVLTFSDVALIDKEKAEKLAERKVGLCLKRDTLDHEVQDGIVGVTGGSKQMEMGYRNLWDAGYGSDKALPVSVNSVLRKGEFNTLVGIIDLHRWVRTNGMEHSIVPIHYCGEAETEDQKSGINPLEVKAAYDIIAYMDGVLFGDPWNVHSAFPKDKTCNRPTRGVHIRATGNVTSCSESPLIGQYIFGNIREEGLVDIIRSQKFQDFRKEFNRRDGKYICNPNVCDLNENNLCRGGCATRSAYSILDPETGLVVPNTDKTAYSQGREDPLCPGWIVLAQKQGALKEGVYEETVDYLLKQSYLEPSLTSEIRDEVVKKFNDLRIG